MMLDTITRTAVDVSLRVGLAPWSTAARLTRRDDEPSSLELAVDQFDASVRQLAGRVLSDQKLLEDAARRQAAVQTRSTAKELRERADEHEAEAEEAATERQRQAEKVRQSTEEQAEQRKAAADKRARQRKQKAASARKSKKQAVKKSAAKRKQAIDKAERAARLEELEDREEALDAKEDALTAADEAERLEEAAAAKKARRSG